MMFEETLYLRDDEADEFGDSGAFGDTLDQDYEEEEEEEKEEAEVVSVGDLEAEESGKEEGCQEKTSQEKSCEEKSCEEESWKENGKEEEERWPPPLTRLRRIL